MKKLPIWPMTQKRWSKMVNDVDEKIESLDERVRLLEQAVFELSTMAKYLKYGFFVIAGSFGVEIQGMM